MARKIALKKEEFGDKWKGRNKKKKKNGKKDCIKEG